jgi:hypothetical protein
MLRGVLTLVAVAILAGCSSAPDLDADVVRAARQELVRLNVPDDGRKVTVEPRGDDAMVIFHLPSGMVGGDVEVLVDRETLQIEDAKIWR